MKTKHKNRNNKKKFIIINQSQFGYHSPIYYYCKYLKGDFEIVYICWDHELPKIEMHGVRACYVSRKGNVLVRAMRFLHRTLPEIKDKQAIVFIKYFKGVSLALRLLRPTHCFVLDIRTASVHKDSVMRWFYDMQLRLETRFFRHVTTISQSLAEKLGIAHKAHILPLGADVISSANKNFDKLHLIYVGTLFDRNIAVTIHGFKQFHDEFGKRIPISYTIIGNGKYNEEAGLKDLVDEFSLTGVITITGLILHNQLARYFDSANIGVSYIPLTDYYNVQPPTKTFEYLLSGMPVIATTTMENRTLINPENGVLIGEKREDFYSGLKTIFEKRHLFDSTKIRNEAMRFAWENIVKENLKPYLARLEEYDIENPSD